MNNQLIKTLSNLIKSVDGIKNIFYSGDTSVPLPMAYQVKFPRLEFVIDGSIAMSIGGRGNEINKINQNRDMVLFVPVDGWNRPEWDKSVTTLSILFCKQQIGFSLTHWDGKSFDVIDKEHITIQKSRVCELMIQSLTELSLQDNNNDTAIQLVKALLCFSIENIKMTANECTRGHALFEAIRTFIENNYQKSITRDSVASDFYISPNYLSFLFRQEGHVKFNDYINYVRLERAKYLLKRFDLTIQEIAIQCGFNDANYFCRIFKIKNALAPTEYRKQFRINN
jgi:AraC-like DNA-binding protein